MVNAQSVAQSLSLKRGEGGALRLRAHDGAVPEHRVVHIAIFGRDIEIAADGDLGKCFLCARDTIAEPAKPFQLVGKRRRSDSLAIRRVNAKNSHGVKGGGNDARLIIDHFIAKRELRVSQLAARQDGDAVIRLLPVENSAVTGGCECHFRKLIVAAFRFLEADDIVLLFREPIEQALLSFAQ